MSRKKLSEEDKKLVIMNMPIKFAWDIIKKNPYEFRRLFPDHHGKIIKESNIRLVLSHNINYNFVESIVHSYVQSENEKILNFIKINAQNDADNITSTLKAIAAFIPQELYSIFLKKNSLDSSLTNYVSAYAAYYNKNGNFDLLPNEIELEYNMVNNQIEVTNPRYISPEPPYDPPKVDNQIVSIFNIAKQDSNAGLQTWLFRLADVSDNTIKLFTPDENNNSFSKRKKFILFNSEGREKEGMVQLYTWTFSENYKDPTKDHIDSVRNYFCKPIEVCICESVSTFEEIIYLIKKGITYIPVFERVLFSCKPINDDYYTAILCDKSDLVISEGEITFAKSVTRVKKYLINVDDIISLDSKNIKLYKYIGIPTHGEYVLLNDPIQITKNIILNRASWRFGKTIGFERRQWQEIKSYLTEMPIKSLLDIIAEECVCTPEQAQTYINTLVEKADTLLNTEDVSAELLEGFIKNDEALRSYCFEHLKEEWEKDNEAIVLHANNHLKSLQSKFSQLESELADLSHEKENLLSEVSKLEEDVKAKEKIAEEVTRKITDKIDSARKNAADFIAEMSFMPQPLSTVSNPGCDIYLHEGSIRFSKKHEVIEYSDIQELIENVLESALLDCGVDDRISYGFAAFLLSAYSQRIPIMLSGVNSLDIAAALSVSLDSQVPMVFDCPEAFSYQLLKDVVTCNSNIVIISGILNSSWLNHISELKADDKYFIFISSFAEDLKIEPVSLWNYVVPILTELLVTGSATSFNVSGNGTPDILNDLEFDKDNKKIKSFERAINKYAHSSRLLTNQLIEILLGVSEIIKDNDIQKIEILCAYFPSAYLSNNADSLLELINQKSGVLKEDMSSQMRFLLEVHDETV